MPRQIGAGVRKGSAEIIVLSGMREVVSSRLGVSQAKQVGENPPPRVKHARHSSSAPSQAGLKDCYTVNSRGQTVTGAVA
ncbi:hypothetical protein KC350_g88 [Hortaea werneckii]|nr:hypothetical protein KC350_g88 [Hortaea werneckii]